MDWLQWRQALALIREYRLAADFHLTSRAAAMLP
jgi:hypothetical protein